MPNQSQTNQNNNSVPFSPQTDMPPFPQELQTANFDEKSTDENANSANSPLPPIQDINNVISSPKKKFGTGKIIATILGILMLVGGLGAGTYLVGQKQIFQQKAAISTISCPAEDCTRCACGCTATGDPPDCSVNNSCNTNCPTNPPSTNNDSTNGQTCAFSCLQTVDDGNGNKICPSGSYSQTGICNAEGTACCKIANSGGGTTTTASSPNCIFDNYKTHNVCTQINGVWQRCDTNPTGEEGKHPDGDVTCKNDKTGTDADSGCTSEYPNCVPGNYCINTTRTCVPSVPQFGNCKADATCGSPTVTAQPSSTPVSTAPYCAAVKAYDASWNLLSSSDLSALSSGTTINFCVSGTAPSGSFDKARFTINGTLQADTTTQRSGSTDFCQSYTIPTDTTTFTVTAQIHHSDLGWF